MKIILNIIAIVLIVVGVILPAALGWWYMAQPDVKSFTVPIQFWIIPFIGIIFWSWNLLAN